MCALRKNGGMGILHLETQNQALLTKWLWKIDTEVTGMWMQTMAKLYGIRKSDQLSINPRISLFVRSLIDQTPFYKVLVRVGDTQTRGQSPHLVWRWQPNGTFSTSSAYNMLHDSGVVNRVNIALWKIKVPIKIRLFLWVTIQNRLLTQQVLIYKGCQVQPGCHLCESTAIETSVHLLRFAKRFWASIGGPRVYIIGST